MRFLDKLFGRSRTGGQPQHYHRTPAQQEAEAINYAQKLAGAIDLAIEKLRTSEPAVSEVLARGQILAGVEKLDMDVSVIRFPETHSGPSPVFGFMWDFIDANDEDVIAEEIVEQIQEAIREGKLPQIASEFLSE